MLIVFSDMLAMTFSGNHRFYANLLGCSWIVMLLIGSMVKASSHYEAWVFCPKTGIREIEGWWSWLVGMFGP